MLKCRFVPARSCDNPQREDLGDTTPLPAKEQTSRRTMKLILALAVFTPGFAMLGAFSTLDSRLPLWWGLTIGALVGLLFGMAFGH